ncbi:MAG: hypothetical protein EXS24_01705 [Pedosphaera sp.]|nr:hypothetical protein [Pedosphaera sp.]
MNTTTRREFLTDVSRGAIVASIGVSMASELGFSSAFAAEASEPLDFGAIEPLVRLMQETPVAKLLPLLSEKLKAGTELRQLTAAAALANARTFGGEDYIGFHTMMALSPALHMSAELTGAQRALPIFKVLYRNTSRIQEKGGRKQEVLQIVKPAPQTDRKVDAAQLRAAVHKKDIVEAEKAFAAIAQDSADDAFNHLLHTVGDETEVHRVALAYRAWDMIDVVGKTHAHTMLRQSLRYCVKSEAYARAGAPDMPRNLLPKLLEEHKLLDRALGTRVPDDVWVEQLGQLIFKSTGAQAAAAAAAALAEGFAPAAIGEAISLAANQLILRDHGRTAHQESLGKPAGSVHGDSIGVHACDSANAWRNLARVSRPRNTFACLILGAYQVAIDRGNRGGDFMNWSPLPVKLHVDQVKETTAATLLREAEESIRQNLQGRAAAIVHRYTELGFAPRAVFDLLLRYAITEDGALHAEKFYRTVVEEYAITRPAFRSRQLIALARVTASEFGKPAPGISEAKDLLKV